MTGSLGVTGLEEFYYGSHLPLSWTSDKATAKVCGNAVSPRHEVLLGHAYTERKHGHDSTSTSDTIIAEPMFTPMMEEGKKSAVKVLWLNSSWVSS